MTVLAVAAADQGRAREAQVLAEKLQLPLLPVATPAQSIDTPDVILYAGEQGLYLQKTGRGAPGPVSAELASAAMRHRRRGGQNELLGRAVGFGRKTPLNVLDATAGLGRDGFVLADLGCRVRLCERHPVIVELLANGLSRAQASDDPWLKKAAGNLMLLPGDARQLQATELAGTDVVYLDPMFPARSKSASVKKEMALFQAVLDDPGTEPDSDALLLWALQQKVARVVVKRPAKAAELADRKPSHVIAGKAVRYDVYVLGPLA